MLKREIGRIVKNNIKLIEYGEATHNYSDKFFLQVGVVGLYCTEKELGDLYDALNYYHNIEGINECKLSLGEDND